MGTLWAACFGAAEKTCLGGSVVKRGQCDTRLGWQCSEPFQKVSESFNLVKHKNPTCAAGRIFKSQSRKLCERGKSLWQRSAPAVTGGTL